MGVAVGMVKVGEAGFGEVDIAGGICEGTLREGMGLSLFDHSSYTFVGIGNVLYPLSALTRVSSEFFAFAIVFFCGILSTVTKVKRERTATPRARAVDFI